MAEPVPEPKPLPEPEPEPMIDVVKALKGNSLVRHQDDSIEVPGQAELVESDIVITGPDSLAEVRLVDETAFKPGPDLELNVSEFSYSSSLSQQSEGSLIAGLLS